MNENGLCERCRAEIPLEAKRCSICGHDGALGLGGGVVVAILIVCGGVLAAVTLTWAMGLINPPEQPAMWVVEPSVTRFIVTLVATLGVLLVVVRKLNRSNESITEPLPSAADE